MEVADKERMKAELFGDSDSDSEDNRAQQELDVQDKRSKLALLAQHKRKEQEEVDQQQTKRSKQSPSEPASERVLAAEAGGAAAVEDEDAVETAEDRAFIDDDGVDLEDRYGSDQDVAAQPEAAEAEEEDELDQMLKNAGKRKGKVEKSQGEKKSLVESFLARMEVAVEMDLEANTLSQPAINKLKLVPEMETVLCQRDLHDEFLDGGVLGVLKAWIEPMPDGSLPNVKIRSAVLRVLQQLHFFFEDRKEQLKKSGLGRVVMFLFKLPDETPANRRIAKELVDRWSKPIFDQYRDSRREEEVASRENAEEERRHDRTATARSSQAAAQPDGLEGSKIKLKPGDPGFRWHAAIPEPARLDYSKKPVSSMAGDPANVRAVGGKGGKDKMMKKLQDLGRKGKESGKASRVSVQGRELVMTK